MSETATDYLLRLIRARARGETLQWDATVDFAQFRQRVRLERLEGLVYSSPLDTGDQPEVAAWLDRLRPGYQQATLLAHQVATSGCSLLADLTSRGIPCFGMRGPFDALELYGDPAARSYSDLDIYVPKAQAYEALALFREKGFELYHQGMPWGFFFRNHLNWTLIHREQGLMCDLHWAVDHPFQRQQIAYDDIFNHVRVCEAGGFSWPSPCLEHWFILSACHLEKHLPDALREIQGANLGEYMLGGRQARSWIDIGLFLSTHGQVLDWRRLLQASEKWQVQSAVAAACMGGHHLMAQSLPETVDQALAHWKVSDAVTMDGAADFDSQWWSKPMRGLSRMADFNLVRLEGVGRYIQGEGGATVIQRIGACLHLALAGLDALMCGLIAWVRTRIFRQRQPSMLRSVDVQEVRP